MRSDINENTAFENLESTIEGSVLTANDDGYNESRTVWNGAVNLKPKLIAQCETVTDVQAVVNFAKQKGVTLSVKGGGHHTGGHAVCEGGVMIDLSNLNSVEVDTDKMTVRVGGGATWDQVDVEVLPRGLLAPGIPAGVGVGGFTVGGGMGVIFRKHGLAVDNLREVELVTSEGDAVTASRDNHSELFWALRGGGGNFGVATSFVFDCVEESTDSLIGQAMYTAEDASDYLVYFRSQMDDLPDALFPIVSYISIPPLNGIPEELHGQPALSVYVMCVGEPDSLRDPLDAYLDYGEPIMQFTDVIPYSALFEPFKIPEGQRHHWECAYLDEISEGLVDTLSENVLPLPTPGTAVNIYGLGGEASRIDHDATAFAHRSSKYLLHITTHWTNAAEDEQHIKWTRALHRTVQPHGNGGEYINNQTDLSPESVHRGFGSHYDRLAKIKAKWDPENLFSQNPNIPPS